MTKYYQYLKKYSPRFLRDYQTGYNFQLGRKSMWDQKLEQMGTMSMGNEDFISYYRKSPRWWTNFICRFLFSLNACFFIWYGFFLGQTDKAWIDFDQPASLNDPNNLTNQPLMYKNLYSVQYPDKMDFQG